LDPWRDGRESRSEAVNFGAEGHKPQRLLRHARRLRKDASTRGLKQRDAFGGQRPIAQPSVSKSDALFLPRLAGASGAESTAFRPSRRVPKIGRAGFGTEPCAIARGAELKGVARDKEEAQQARQALKGRFEVRKSPTKEALPLTQLELGGAEIFVK
jgi:hypothetical protein